MALEVSENDVESLMQDSEISQQREATIRAKKNQIIALLRLSPILLVEEEVEHEELILNGRKNDNINDQMVKVLMHSD